MNHLRDIAGQEIHAGDIIAYVSTGLVGPGLKIGKVLSVNAVVEGLIVWGIDDDFPALSRAELSKMPSTIKSTRVVVLDRSKIRRDYMELLAAVSSAPTFDKRKSKPKSTNKPAERYLTLVPPPDPRRRN